MIDQPQGGKPALTVIIQSWWTPALAVIMLVVGFLAGYLGRPLISKGTEMAAESPTATAPAATTPGAQVTVPTMTVDPTIAAITNQEQLMAYLVSNTTHFKGDPNAEVIMIEFSDYQ